MWISDVGTAHAQEIYFEVRRRISDAAAVALQSVNATGLSRVERAVRTAVTGVSESLRRALVEKLG
jgi:hypothetical protein